MDTGSKGKTQPMAIIEIQGGPITRDKLRRWSRDNLESEFLSILDFCDAKERKRSEWEAKLRKFGGFMLTCRKHNTDEWMGLLAERLTEASKSLCERKTYKYDGQDMIDRVT